MSALGGTTALLLCVFTGRDPVQYKIAGILIGVGVLVNRASGVRPAEPAMDDLGRSGPVN